MKFLVRLKNNIKIRWAGVRIIETNEKFIVQVRPGNMITGDWFGLALNQIDDDGNQEYSTWVDIQFQEHYCYNNTLEEAQTLYYGYLDSIETVKTKVHVMPEPPPKFWRILQKTN